MLLQPSGIQVGSSSLLPGAAGQGIPLSRSACCSWQVFWGHGTRDEILHNDLQDEGVEVLREAGLKVTAKKLGVNF